MDQVLRVPVGKLRPSALQPRRDFPEESLQELAESIRAQGILQPLVVRRQGEWFELIAGERRWRASQRVGLAEVPVVVRDVPDGTVLEWMLVENLQREGLNPMDEAQGYQELVDQFGLTQEQVAEKVGRSRAGVANALRLLKLPEVVQGWVREGQLSVGHAKVVLGLGGPEAQVQAGRSIVEGGLSVRGAEDLVAQMGLRSGGGEGGGSGDGGGSGGGGRRPGSGVALRDPHVAALEDRLRERLGTKVTLRYRKGRGQVDIRFYSDAELERFLELVGVRMDDVG